MVATKIGVARRALLFTIVGPQKRDRGGVACAVNKIYN